MATEKEKKDKWVGALVTVGVHGAIIILFMFILAWKQPFPPKPEYGIELNIGLEQEGSGTVQPETVSDTPTEEDQESPSETQQAEEDMKQEVEEQALAAPPENIPEETEKQPEEVINDSRQEESPVKATPEVKKEPEVLKKEITPETNETENKPEENKEPVETVKKEKPAEKPVVKETVNKSALYPGTKGGNQGKTSTVAGDAGKPEGTKDARAIYGNQGGGGGGPMLDLPGWKWDFTPKPEDPSKEIGKIVFEIKVDEQGDVISVKTLESTVSPDILPIYRKEVERLTFSPTNSNSAPPPVSTGKITFIIRVK